MQEKSPASFKALILLAIPMIVSQGAMALMMFTDRLFLSKLSPVHLAASLGGGMTAFFCSSLFMGVISYGNALAAQYFGAKDYAACPKVLTQGLLLTLCCIPFIIVITFLGPLLFVWMGHSPLEVTLETQYFTILQVGAVFALMRTAFASYFIGTSKTFLVMVVDLTGVIINIPLSWLLIFGFDQLPGLNIPALGISGAAIGTLISNMIALGLYIILYLDKWHQQTFSIKSSWCIDRAILKKYLRLGVPSGIDMFLGFAAFNLFVLLFQSFGVVEGASAAIVFNWDMLSVIPLMGLNAALTSLVGQHYGANDMHGLEKTLKGGFVIAFIYTLMLTLLFYIYKDTLIEIFNPPHSTYYAEILDLSRMMMMGLICYMIADAAIQVSEAGLKGTGDTRWMMVASVGLHGFMLLSQILIIKVFGLSSLASWAAFVIFILLLSVTFVYRLACRPWQKMPLPA
ncbi:MAG: MATE family efflux transporter [Cellvibrionales bacterium]|nr:MATE family efflux transporter [Cellvibrionales bacterium]